MTLPPESRPPESSDADGWPADVHPNYTGPRRAFTRPVDSAPIPVPRDDSGELEIPVDEATGPETPAPGSAIPDAHAPHASGPIPHPSGPFRPQEQHDEGPWSGGLPTPPPVVVMPRQRPVRPTRSIPKRPIAIAVAALVILGGLGVWVSTSSDDEPAPAPTAPTPSAMPESEARERLGELLPPGYAAAACEPVATPKGALAKFGCERNSDPGGPPLATYTLLPDRAALKVAFDDIIRASTVVNCPGAIQSPGPWRRNASPNVVAGTLFCGFQRDLPTLAWTDDAELLVAAVRGDERGPTLEQLYRWWSSHS